MDSFEPVVPRNRDRGREGEREGKEKEKEKERERDWSLSKSRSYRLPFLPGAPRAALLGFHRGRTLLRAREKRRLGPAMCFEWIYMTSQRVAMSLFARVRAYVRARRPACGQRFPAAADVGPSSRVPLRDTKLAMIIPYLPGEGQGRIVLLDSSAPRSSRWRNRPFPTTPRSAKTSSLFFTLPFIYLFFFLFLSFSILSVACLSFILEYSYRTFFFLNGTSGAARGLNGWEFLGITRRDNGFEI